MDVDTDKIGILDKRLAKRMDLFRIVLVHAAEKTPLPELLEIFGSELTVKFLDIFAGTTVRVPAADVLRNAARDTDIFLTVRDAEKKREAFKDLAEKYDLEGWYVKELYGKLEKVIGSRYRVVNRAL